MFDDALCLDLLREILFEQAFEVAAFCNSTFFETCVTTERCPEESPCADLVFTRQPNACNDRTGFFGKPQTKEL